MVPVNVRGWGNGVTLPLQGLTGPDGPAGKDGPPGEQVSVSWSFEMPRIHSRMEKLGFIASSLLYNGLHQSALTRSMNPNGTHANFACRSLEGSNRNKICDFRVNLNLSNWISILVGNIFNEGSVWGLFLLLLNPAWNVNHFSPICKTLGDVIGFLFCFVFLTYKAYPLKYNMICDIKLLPHPVSEQDIQHQ